MASGEKNDIEKYTKMYQDLQNAMAMSRRNYRAADSDATPEQVQPNVTNSQVPPPLAPLSASVRTILDKRTYEQVYKEELKIRHKIVYVTPEKKKPKGSQHVPERSPERQFQDRYTTTFYNITPHDVSKGAYMSAKEPLPTSASGSLIKPVISIPKPTMEVISYQNSHSNAYAKRLIEITRSSMKKMEVAIPSGSNFRSQPTNSTHPTIIQSRDSTNPQPSNYVQNFQHCNVKGKADGKHVQPFTSSAAQQKEIYLRIQAQQERRQVPIPSPETFAQSGEAVHISKHRSNVMLSIVNPTVSSSIPTHVYGAPGVGTRQVQDLTKRFAGVRDPGSTTTVRIQNELNYVTDAVAEPPPAHVKPTCSSQIFVACSSAPSAATMDQSNGKEAHHHPQEQVLNLDTKQTASHSVAGTEPCAIVIPVSRTLQAEHTNSHAPQFNSVPMENKSVAMVQNASTDPTQPNTAMTMTSPTPSQQTIWNHLQNRNIQQLLAHLQTQQIANNSSQMTIMDHVKLNLLLRAATEKSADATQAIPILQPFGYEKKTPEFAMQQEFPVKPKTPSKRKNATEEGDACKKRKPKPKHSMEPFLQNEPCYKISSRLPRCRECGRSAAARSRHALNIFCRFFAFRKLRYNKIGKLEVAGFADPYRDPKDEDISLWSANLQQVPVDLSNEKSKFLLGQVGYKFCELFHQEKEAHFEHLSQDKTIAWKQAVQGIREMCDVCQTTLFNHHWVCSTCGFVVCIDCYKWRKDGIITAESTTKDKDPHGWLLCSNGKEPHSQDQLMLTQIIPSNCMYKLVRQMHGVCALLEIPLNCECPLSKEPLFRKIKDRLEFIYPTTVSGRVEEEEVFYDFNGPISAPTAPQITRMVSITIKSIAQLAQLAHRQDGGVESEGGDEPITCRIEFSKQFHEDGHAGRPGDDGSRGTPTNETTTNEKQSYSFEGFQKEIRAEGDHFDESLYKIPSKDDLDVANLKVEEEDVEQTKDACSKNGKVENMNSNGEGYESSSNCRPDLIISQVPRSSGATSDVELREEAVSKVEPMDNSIDDAYAGEQNAIPMNASADLHRIEVTITKEITKTECESGTETEASDTNGATPTAGKKEIHLKQEAAKEQPIQTVPYSEEGRYKPSPPIDSTTFAMIVKQMVKFDKTVDIFSTFERHMRYEADQLDDFDECISVKPERVRRFLVDFLNDFVFLRGQNSSDDLTNERQILDYNRQIKDGLKFRNKGERRMHLNESSALYPEVAHEWLCNGKLLRLLDPLDVRNYQSFHDQWERGQPVMVSAVSSKMNMDLWIPESFGRDFGEQVNDLVNCFNGKVVRGHPMKAFWEGFEQIRERLLDERDRPMMLKLKDWPPGDDFAEMMPTRFYDLMKSLPLAEYTRREGRLNLASRLSGFFVRPDLGPKMYSAYGSALHPNKGTTNLHLDISDAVNVMVYVGVPTDVPRARYNEKILEVIDTEDCDYLTRQRIRERKEVPGALWHIYHAQDADRIRQLLNKIEQERGGTIKADHDPIHDQKWYLDRNMRRRLQQEYGVEGYAIVQCSGDAIFIPAGAPHQVRNLHNCIKVAEDFVSPENISYCFKLTNEFRHLSKTHSNHEDKLQIKNIIYHAVKDAVSSITNPLIMMAGECNPVGGSVP